MNGEVISQESDLYALYKHTKKLDSLCKQLGLPLFSRLLDDTDLRFNLDEFELPEGATSTNDVMKLKGVWDVASEVTSQFKTLAAHIQQNQVRFGLFSNQHAEVLEELRHVIAFAQQAAQQNGQFNFSVVM